MPSQIQAASPTAPSPTFSSQVQSLRQHQKSSRGVPPYSQYFNRPFGRRIAAAASLTRLTPNQLSLISFAISSIGILLIGIAPAWTPIGVVISAALVLGYATDSADGQLARLRGGGSPLGEWLDHCLDAAKIAGLHLAVLVAAIRIGGSAEGWHVSVAVLFTWVAVTNFFVFILTDQIRRQLDAAPPERGTDHGLAIWLASPVDWGFQSLWFVTYGWPSLFFAGYGALAVANLFYLVFSVRRKAAELSRIPS
jgi:phosphatidylglycerophosphate synthase